MVPVRYQYAWYQNRQMGLTLVPAVGYARPRASPLVPKALQGHLIRNRQRSKVYYSETPPFGKRAASLTTTRKRRKRAMAENQNLIQSTKTQASDTLPAMIDRAAKALASATTAGEILEAQHHANMAYAEAKSVGRMARARKAHDDIIGAVYRAQANALEIEARAKMRLADEYDAAQARGEVASGNRAKDFGVLSDNAKPATAKDLGFNRREIHEARKLRDAEAEEPGFVKNTLDAIVAAGEEPTKAALKKAHVAHNSGQNEWYTPAAFIEAARQVMGGIDLDPASSEIANRTVQAARYFTAEDNGLAQDWPACRIWMNPPYAQPLISQFSKKIAEAADAGAEAIVLVNNATETAWFQRMLQSASALCFPEKRVRFLDPDGNPGAPLQGQALLYFGSNVSAFTGKFSEFGGVALMCR